MREIKFRAWDKLFNRMCDHIDIIDFDGNDFIEGTGKNGAILIEKKDCVLMQYTGLKDKNGKEIYEGDVILLRGKKCFVEYEAPEYRFKLYRKSKNSAAYGMGFLPEMEVIGNIYENPELLKPEENNE